VGIQTRLESTDVRQTLGAGAASLLIELAFLRYLPGHIRVLGYFTNFVLLAAFVGLGVGKIAARRWPKADALRWSAPLGVAALVAFAALGRNLNVGGLRSARCSSRSPSPRAASCSA